MVQFKNIAYRHPWVVLGDFNAIKRKGEKFGEMARWEAHEDEFNVCCNKAHLDDHRFMGNFFTWSNISEGNHHIACKLDRILVNEKWLDVFLKSLGIFLPSRLSDHSLCILLGGDIDNSRRSHFKFFNFWVNHEDFLLLVSSIWQEEVVGNSFFHLVKKLKKLKMS